jgi:F-type H+-transporting ATPase subunit b
MRIGLWLVPALLLFPVASYGETGSGDPMTLDLWQAGFTIVVFALLLIILRVVAWKPMLQALKDRENFIRDSLESAKRDREEAETRLKEYTAQIDKARQEATAIVDEGRRDSEVLRLKINEDAKKEAEAMLTRARREIGIARDTAVKDLYTLSGDLATRLAGRILRKELDPKTHERLIKESLDEIQRLETRN